MTRCRVCGCTEVNACNPPCGWTGDGTICTSCAHAASAIADWMDGAVRANITGLIREAKAIYKDEALLQVREAQAAKRSRRK